MGKLRENTAIGCYLLAIFLGIANALHLVYVNWDDLTRIGAMGSRQIIWFLVVSVVTLPIWATAFYLKRRWALTLVYVASLLPSVLVFVFFPIKFFAE